MNKIINTCLFVSLVIGPLDLAFADEAPVPPSESAVAAPSSTVAAQVNNDSDIQKKAEEEAKIKAEEEAKKNAEDEARRKAEDEARKKAEDDKVLSEKAAAQAKAAISPAPSIVVAEPKPQEPVALPVESRPTAEKTGIATVSSAPISQPEAAAGVSNYEDRGERFKARIRNRQYPSPTTERGTRRGEIIGGPKTIVTREDEEKQDGMSGRRFSRPYMKHHEDFVTEQSSVRHGYVIEKDQVKEKNSFTGNLRDVANEVNRQKVIVQPKRNVVVVEDKTPDRVRPNTSSITIIKEPNDVRRFRERELRERELRRRELEMRDREERLKNAEFKISQKERAYRDREWYNRQLRKREWQDIEARDQELRYLLWREEQMNRYFWRDNGRICQYVTTYQTGVRTNKRVTICEWRRGVYTCFHPKRYYIFPVTRLVCFRGNDKRVIIRNYPY